MRSIVVFTMVTSFFVLGFCDIMKQNWRTGIDLTLLGIVQALIFWKGMK